jgi:hypothetical protein
MFLMITIFTQLFLIIQNNQRVPYCFIPLVFLDISKILIKKIIDYTLLENSSIL